MPYAKISHLNGVCLHICVRRFRARHVFESSKRYETAVWIFALVTVGNTAVRRRSHLITFVGNATRKTFTMTRDVTISSHGREPRHTMWNPRKTDSCLKANCYLHQKAHDESQYGEDDVALSEGQSNPNAHREVQAGYQHWESTNGVSDVAEKYTTDHHPYEVNGCGQIGQVLLVANQMEL